ncbi:MAG: MBL fold metallo-hydrolase [Candidatus Riflebacteria bacterium HGW-Riflebacteria-1]|jgi:ribonuclease Z|nr:MAG: MBL fold metallo-hydrolase [Candidatus Riflebacteria bacterium HGW-Riflebacteria-1]
MATKIGRILMTTPQFPLQDQLCGFSRALFSTWLYHRRFNILFDAGEGVATSLCNRVFGIRRIFLSHGHADHIAGLVNLLNIRNLGAGDQTASLKIYIPKNNKLIEFMMDYLARTQKALSFELEWIPIDADEDVMLDDQRNKVFLRTFKTKHSQRQLSLGYNIIEKRRRLKPEYEALSQREINQIVWTKGKEEIATEYEKIIFSYGGDSRPINPDLVRESLFLCHESTYMSSDDDERNFQQHSILDEVLEMAKQANVETLLLFHTSLRYNLDELREKINAAKARIEPGCQVLVLCANNIIDTANEGSWRKKMRKDSLKEQSLDGNSF